MTRPHACSHLLISLLFLAPVVAQEGLTVQTRWRIAVATCGWDKPYPAREVVVEAGGYVSRELPGIEWEVLEGTIDAGALETPGGEALASALEKAIAPDAPAASCDLVVAFAPFEEDSNLFGYALADFRPGGDERSRPVWFTAINLHPEQVLVGGIERGLAGRGLKEEGDRLAELLSPFAGRLLADSRTLRHSLVATVVHEFGHFLAPGDRDVKDGLQADWIQNGDPDDNPDAHDLVCVMYRPKSVRSIFAKATRAFPDGIRFCERCRERLGVPR